MQPLKNAICEHYIAKANIFESVCIFFTHRLLDFEFNLTKTKVLKPMWKDNICIRMEVEYSCCEHSFRSLQLQLDRIIWSLALEFVGFLVYLMKKSDTADVS